jgi:hypothetical protein
MAPGKQESAVEAFLRVFKSLTRIFIPVLKVLLVDLRRLAAQVSRFCAKEPGWRSTHHFAKGGPCIAAKW